VEKAIDGLPGFDPDLRLRLIHALLAHHGQREKGSPVVPATLEAIVLHYADNLDAAATGAIDFVEGHDADAYGLTDNSPMHDTKLYRGLGRRP
jgi:3'-5' exoribonuclease